MPRPSAWAAAALAALCLGAAVHAAPAPAPADAGEVIRLYPGPAPGSETARQAETAEGGFARNVTVPTLTVFRPRPGTATGAAVIVVPGGAFEFVSMSNEGVEVARRLAEHGVVAVVLKYRVNETPAAAPAAYEGVRRLLARMTAMPLADRVAERYATPGAALALADAAAALRSVRGHAAAWGIAPGRVGMLGFSAGAMVTLQLALGHDPEVRPDFVGAIYGALPRGAVPPPDAPPLFLALAADDSLFGPPASLPIYAAWRAAGREAELHVYASGEHGFGMEHQHKPSDHWIDAYLWWLEAHGAATGG